MRSNPVRHATALGANRFPLGGKARKTAGFLRVCPLYSGFRECNERSNLSPNGLFSPRHGAMGLSAPGQNSLKFLVIMIRVLSENLRPDCLGNRDWQRIFGHK